VLAIFAPRLIRTAAVFVLVTVGIFGLTALLPGDPALALAGENPTPELIASIREQLGLDRPLYEQYFGWLLALFSGDLGTSLYFGVPVGELIIARLPVTLSLTLVAVVISIVLGLAGGMVAAARRGTIVDRLATVLSTIGIATPNFWFGMIFIIVFAFGLGWFPAVGYAPLADGVGPWLAHLILPATALALAGAAELMRQTRSSMTDTLGQDYIRTARAQGLRPAAIYWRRALRNASIPLVTVVAFQVALLLGGVVIVEKIFGLPGLGSLVIDAVFSKDLPVVQGVVLVNAIIVLSLNLLTDFLYTLLNPKVRHG